MSFINLPISIKIMTNPFKKIYAWKRKKLLEDSFKHASAAITKKRFTGDPLEKAIDKESIRIKLVGTMIAKQLKSSANSFPPLDVMPEIYQELVDVLVGMKKLRKARDSMTWTANKIKDFQMKYLQKMKEVRNTKQARIIRKEYYGRVSSLVHKIRNHMDLLVEVAKLLKNFPDIEDLPTVIITGFPNVGKSSVLGKITGSRPKVFSYPFTTKGLMLGFREFRFEKVQFIDTPGLFDRPASKRNAIEKQGEIVMKNLADAIIYVYDISEICGYSLDRQKRLHREIKRQFKNRVIAVANKIDVVGGKDPNEVDAIPISTKTGEGIEEVRKAVQEILEL